MSKTNRTVLVEFKEEAFLAALSLGVVLLVAFTGWFETAASLLSQKIGWNLNEVLTATLFLAIVLIVYSGGRTLQLHRVLNTSKQLGGEAKNTVSLLTSTLDSTGDGILVVSDEGKFALWNQRFVEMWNVPEHIVESKDDDLALSYVCDQLSHPDAFLDKVRELYDQPEAESFDTLEFKDGRVFDRYSRPHRLEDKVVGRVWSFRDVTEKRRSKDLAHRRETELRQSQKLEAVGQLAGGVAHDFNNLLMVIQGHTDFLVRHLAGQEGLGVRALEVQKAANRAAALTRQLLLFSRKQTPQPKILDFNDLITEMTRMLERLLPETIDMRFEPGSDLGFLRADPVHLEQVVMNLVINARDAMPDGGRITMKTTKVDIGENAARSAGHRSGAHVNLTIIDTGHGMDSETQSRIFEPFFTTKGKTEGTGLGLSVVYGIIKQSGGDITVESSPGKGTRVHVLLPVAENEAGESTRWEDKPTFASNGETVLVVEDEDPVRAIVCDVLSDHGYTVLESPSSEKALEIARNHRGPIHLTLSDVVMPGLNGCELAKRVQEMHPETAVVYMSGYSDAIREDRGMSGDAVLLEKPVSPNQLLIKIHEVLSRPPDRKAA